MDQLFPETRFCTFRVTFKEVVLLLCFNSVAAINVTSFLKSFINVDLPACASAGTVFVLLGSAWVGSPPRALPEIRLCTFRVAFKEALFLLFFNSFIAVRFFIDVIIILFAI